MLCWICSESSHFRFTAVQFIRAQLQWAGLRFRCFGGDTLKMAQDLGVAMNLPDVIILDQRGGWDIDAGVELCRALHRRDCSAPLIYLDLTVTHGLAAKYLVEIHEEDEFVDIRVMNVEMIENGWEEYLVDAVEEALERPLALARSRPAVASVTNPFSDN